jgi:hypothetical protein
MAHSPFHAGPSSDRAVDISAAPDWTAATDTVFQTRSDQGPQGIGGWVGLLAFSLFWYGFLTMHAIGFVGGITQVIWSEVRSGDFTHGDLLRTIGLTIAVYLVLIPFYGAFSLAPVLGTERLTTTLDAPSRQLIVTRRYIFSIHRSNRVALADLTEVRLDSRTDGETGEVTWRIQAMTARGKAISLSNYVKDRTEAEALADRLRAALQSAGWSGETPQPAAPEAS